MRASAAAFTLTEMMIVLLIIGLIVGIVSFSAPAIFERGAFREADAKLRADLSSLARTARDDGRFAELQLGEDGRSYQMKVGGDLVDQQLLPAAARLEARPNPIVIDPAGRAVGAVTLKLGGQQDVLQSDPLTGDFVAVQPAMVLVEALVASGIIAVVAGLFLMVLSDTGLSVGVSRDRAREVMIGSQVLEEARALGPAAPTSGETLGRPWKLVCAISSTVVSRRLDLVECRVTVRGRGSLFDRAQVTLQTAFASPKGRFGPQ